MPPNLHIRHLMILRHINVRWLTTVTAPTRPPTRATVQGCLQKAVKRFPNYATAWALLSLTYLDELRFRYRLNSTIPSLDLATAAARRAVELDPQNVRALQAEMLSHYFHGDITAALEVGARAYSINPNDTELGRIWLSACLVGQWKPGCKLIASAVYSTPGSSGYFESALAVCAYMDKDYVTAERWARLADVRVIRFIMSYSPQFSGSSAKLRRPAASSNGSSPASTFMDNIRHEVAVRVIRREDQLHFIDGLRKAGLSIPDE